MRRSDPSPEFLQRVPLSRGWLLIVKRFGREAMRNTGTFLVPVVCWFSLVSVPGFSMGQQMNEAGWPVPSLKGLIPYSMNIKTVDGIEKITEKFYTPAGGHVARILGNGRVFAYVVDSDQEPPIDYLLLDPNGSGIFTQKFGPHDSYLIPEWIR